MAIDIRRYTSSDRTLWNRFIREAKNATFLFEREYMDYHSDRFTDCSLIFEREGKMLALLPANIEEDTLVSHRGLTYGGLVMSHETKATDVIEIFELLRIYIKEVLKARILIYKPLPHIYCPVPSEEPLYALTRMGASISSRTISTTIATGCNAGINEQRKRGVKRAANAGIYCRESSDFAAFWNILDNLLKERHHTTPTHTLSEISLLAGRFPHNIRLFTANGTGDTVLAGVVVYETANVAHLQYIAASPAGKKAGALDMLIMHLIENVYKEKQYIDFGISTENGGKVLNEGLISQKEGFGGRAIVYDTYEMQA